MIKNLISRDWAVRRMSANHLGIILEPFALHLEGRGHSRNSIQQYLQAVEHFGRWMGRCGIRLQQLNETHLQRFLARHLPRCRCPMPAMRTRRTCQAAVRRLIVFARERGLIINAPPSIRRSALDRLIDDFDTHLRDAAGLAPSTRHHCCRHAREFLLERLGADHLDLRTISRRDLVRHVLRRTPGLKHSSIRILTGALRSFLRFLHLTGRIESFLIDAVPRPAPWPLARLPDTISEAQMSALQRSFDWASAAGQRDYAIFLCLAQLGMRTHETASLMLDDVDWRGRAIRLHQTKQRRERWIPLPAAVIRALANYVRQGRPETSSRALFVRQRAPLGEAVQTHHVRGAMRRAFARAGLSTGRIHLLRHTLATRLHRRGVGLKAIADLLGHRNMDTSARYARVNLEELRQAAQPWPRRS